MAQCHPVLERLSEDIVTFTVMPVCEQDWISVVARC